MPVEHHTETVEHQREVSRYVCDVPACGAYATGFDPKHDPDVASTTRDVGHNINFVALNPHIDTQMKEVGGCSTPRRSTRETELTEQEGLYLCDRHIDRAGELLLSRLTAGDDE